MKFIKHRALFAALMQIQHGQVRLPPRPVKFRVSELPFCPLLYVEREAEYVGAPDMVDFASAFYFNMGHATHNLWQSAATTTLPDSLIGDWQCNRVLAEKLVDGATTRTTCNRIVRFCSFNKIRKQACPHDEQNCALQHSYRELSLRWAGLTGHTDFVWRHQRQYHLVDFKSTSSFLFREPDIAIGNGYYPSAKYFEQIETYAVMLERRYKIRIATITICYISRDRATHEDNKYKRGMRLFTIKLTDEIRRQRIKNIRMHHRRYRMARRWLQATPTARLKLTKALYAARPCHSHLDYHNYMATAFFKNDPCPHHRSGDCYNGKMYRTLQRLAKRIAP